MTLDVWAIPHPMKSNFWGRDPDTHWTLEPLRKSLKHLGFLKCIYLFEGINKKGLSCTCGSQHVAVSSLTKDQTQAPSLGAWGLSHWTTMEVPMSILTPIPGISMDCTS